MTFIFGNTKEYKNNVLTAFGLEDQWGTKQNKKQNGLQVWNNVTKFSYLGKLSPLETIRQLI